MKSSSCWANKVFIRDCAFLQALPVFQEPLRKHSGVSSLWEGSAFRQTCDQMVFKERRIKWRARGCSAGTQEAHHLIGPQPGDAPVSVHTSFHGFRFDLWERSIRATDIDLHRSLMGVWKFAKSFGARSVEMFFFFFLLALTREEIWAMPKSAGESSVNLDTTT